VAAEVITLEEAKGVRTREDDTVINPVRQSRE
jgi:hypothetical protein